MSLPDKAAAHGRWCGLFLLAHDTLPRDHRAMIDLAELVEIGELARARIGRDDGKWMGHDSFVRPPGP